MMASLSKKVRGFTHQLVSVMQAGGQRQAKQFINISNQHTNEAKHVAEDEFRLARIL